MAEPKPLPACANCDQVCETLYDEDGECWGRMTQAERVAFGQMIVAQAQEPAPQATYGRPQALPVSRVPEAQKHHITRSGK